ncbi:MAG: DNA ligase [Nanoarchaeota archaeon]|jgi:DNA ligase-1|nr:DNA ligase [Nanoarchaeota archaeon]|tara:strand:- start:12110 stop:13774 length:1665 start_codon:yes stop_codon:yes gene_type:complete
MEYSELVKIYEDLESTSKRLEKIEILSNFLRKVAKKELKEIVYLAEGRIFAEWDKRKIGFSNRLMIKALSSGSGESSSKIETLFRKKGDLGLVAEEVFQSKKQMTLMGRKLDTGKVMENIRKLSELEGKGTVSKKISFISELLVNAKGKEAKYIVKTVLENLRIGVSSGIIRDSIAKAFKAEIKDVEEAGDLSGDYGEVAVLAKDKNLKSIGLGVGKPVRSMLALLVEDIEDGFKALGEPCQFENKIDGFRLQCHGSKGKVNLFTRRMEDVTSQFPDIVKFLKNVRAESYILDCEAVGYDSKTGKYLPFQSISQRIKRKYDIEDMAKKFPMELFVFDVLYCNGKNLMSSNLKERREILERIIKEKKKEISVSEKLVTKDKKKAGEFFKKILKEGFEGLMVKNLESKYRPGRYVGGWMKLKNILEPLDLVILGAEYGEGKRAGWLTSFIVGCKDGNKFLEVGRVSTGIKEKGEDLTYKDMTKLLKPLIVSTKGKGVGVKPKIVIEVAYEEIQKSSKYSSGFGLRFPRVVSLRVDKPSNEVNNLKLVKKIFKMQRK